MGEVLRALEGPIAPMFCASDDPEHATACDRSARCTVNVLWVRVRDARHRRARRDDPRRSRARCPGAPTTLPTTTLTGALTTLVTDPAPLVHPRPPRRARSPSPRLEILQGIDLTVGKGEVHAIMGPNGSGKTTLAYALMGHPSYQVTGGEVIWKGRDILELSPDKRSRLGMFLAFQYPTAIPGL